MEFAFAPSAFFASPAEQPRSKKSLPFPLPDPYADDATFEIYDPHGMFSKARRPSNSSHSRAGTAGSDSGSSAGVPHSRERSESASGGEGRLGSSLFMTSTPLEFRHGSRSWDRSDTSDRVPSLSPSLKDEVTTNESLPELGAVSSPINIDLHPSTPAFLPQDLPSSPPQDDLLASPRGRNPLNRLRIGSTGASAFVPFATSPIHRVDESPARMDDSFSAGHSRGSSISDNSSALPWSPAASFLSTFSPDSGRGGGFGAGLNGDEEGFCIAGYVLGRELGAGGFGVVREATRVGDGVRVAVKIVRHTSDSTPSPPGGEGLRRSVSQHKAAGAGITRRVTVANERSRSFSSPAPPQGQTSGHPLARTVSSQMRDLSASLSALAAPSDPTAPPSIVQSLLEREILLWQQLSPHPHILPLLDVHHEDAFSYIFMPLCEGGNLLSYLNDYERSKIPAGKKKRGRSSIPIAPIASLSPSPSGDLQALRGLPPTPKGLPLPICRAIFAQVVSGLHYLHTEARVTHKDIKLENILCDEPGGTWKIADFGLAESAATTNARGKSTSRRRPKGGGGGGGGGDGDGDSSDSSDSSVPTPSPRSHGHFLSASDRGPVHPGTPLASLSRANSLSRPSDSSQSIADHLYPAGSLPYSPPEQMRSPTPILDPSVDLWALGCVLYALVEGTLPFEDEFEPRLRMRIMKGTWDIPAALEGGGGGGGDKALVLDVLKHLLEPDPRKRWTIEEVRGCEWLTGEGARGRSSGGAGRGRGAFVSGDGSGSRSRSVGGTRRKERSTSRGPIAHYAVDPRTRERERGIMEQEEKKSRWRSPGGSRMSKALPEGVPEERLGRGAEPY